MIPKKDLEAVHRQDIKTLLGNWGLLSDFQAGNIKCKFCSDIILEQNLGAIFSANKQIFFSCSKSNCLAELSHKK